MVLLLKQDGMEIDDGLVVAAAGKPGVMVGGTSVPNKLNASSTTVRAPFLYRHPFLTWTLVKRRVDELGRRLEKVVIQEEPGPSQEEGQEALPSVGSDRYVLSNS